ncbi:MAG: glycosyltransferase family 2 protein [Elusimicrobiales bacterium]|jgi:glycosyltransferase involved in cell wall biosynthesis
MRSNIQAYNTEKKDVTVCIPVFNGEKTISSALESALKIHALDVEILVSDNASEDGTRNVVLKYQGKYPDRIRLILNERNTGFAGNYKKCLKEASGKYLFFIGADDSLNHEGLSVLINRLENHPDEAIVTSDLNVFYINPDMPTRKLVHFSGKEKIFSAGDDALCNWLLNSALGSIGGYLIRKSVVYESVDLIPDVTIVPQLYLGAYIACRHGVSHVPVVSFAQRLSRDESQLANKQYLSADIINEILFLINSLSMLYKNELKNDRHATEVLKTQYINGLIDNILPYRCFAPFGVFVKVISIIVGNNRSAVINPKFMIYLAASISLPKLIIKKILFLYRSMQV